MGKHTSSHPDFGTGDKKLSVYTVGLLICILLTLLAFWVVMANTLSKQAIFAIIYSSAIIQFFVQLICFIRLNTQTEQGRINVMGLVFVGVILLSVIVGSLWIMWNLNFYMVH